MIGGEFACLGRLAPGLDLKTSVDPKPTIYFICRSMCLPVSTSKRQCNILLGNNRDGYNNVDTSTPSTNG